MILNSANANIFRANAQRLAANIRSKDDLADLLTAASFGQVFSAIENLLTSTDMYFDDELLMSLDESNWQQFKALISVYTCNILNRQVAAQRPAFREYGAQVTM